MEHVVFFPGPDGAPAFRRVPTLDEAVRFVEHLRNAEGVTEVSVQALTPVPLSFRTYYKVETPGGDAPVSEGRHAEVPNEARHADVPAEMPAPAPAPVEPPAADVPAAAEAPEEAPELVAVADGQAPSGGGKRSLGFFAH